MRLAKRIAGWLGLGLRVDQTPAVLTRGRVDHVIIFDGTMTSLKEGCESNAGLTYKILRELAPSQHLSLRYESGVQWHHWRSTMDVITGKGINRQIRRAYGFLASRYRVGDRIFLLGFSRGAYAARSLAGVIDRIGLLTQEHATVRNIRQIYRHYEYTPHSDAAQDFAKAYCHDGVEIEMVGVWDTVKSLGIRLPVLWRETQPEHDFHSHHLGNSIRHGFHALAMDETRMAFVPVMWDCPSDWQGVMEQMWFRGCHSDIGGHLTGFDAARPLSNIPLVWMLEKLAGCDVCMPDDYRERFAVDPDAPSVGSFRGWAKLFLWRRRRVIGRDMSEHVHPSAQGHKYAHRVSVAS
ncbi:MAG: DUF2235 domain-containing protein [Marinosulfonomonas sp.]|nr:DUF2235 domain-containing protein [Marinosulfonomonas sp.]